MKNADAIKVLLIGDAGEAAALAREELAFPAPGTLEITSAQNLEAAARRIATGSVDVVLLDLGDKSEFELESLSEIQTQAPTTPVIVLTCSDNTVLATEALRRGAMDFLVKSSISGNLLRRAIRYSIERKRSDDALLASEARFRSLIEQAGDAIFVHDFEGRLIDVNHRACESLGYTREGLLALTLPDIELTTGRRAPSLWSHLVRGKPVTVDGVHRRKDGSTFPVEVRLGLFEHADERLILALARDTSGRQRLEEDLRRYQKLEALGQLAGGVAHDFNNLLTYIASYNEFLANSLEDDSPLRSYVEQIQKAQVRGAALTQQLLAFSRQQVLEPLVIHLNHVVTGIEPMLRRLIGENIEIVTELDPMLGRVLADASQIEQVITNLSVNSRDSMPDGGTLTIKTENVVLDAAVAARSISIQPGPHVMLAVSDTGCGMDPETEVHMFEPFFTTKAPGDGTGLGLATVHGIVEQSGGSVLVCSEPGVGTSVKVYLPRVSQSADVKKPDDEINLSLRGNETVLLVEDEDMVRAAVSTALVRRGYTVLEAANGIEALRIAANHRGPLDALITDVVMPKLGGRELAAQLTESSPGIRVMFVSGYSRRCPDGEETIEERDAYLQKPFAPRALAAALRQLLDRPTA